MLPNKCKALNEALACQLQNLRTFTVVILYVWLDFSQTYTYKSLLLSVRMPTPEKQTVNGYSK